jgi:hypothetical protein
MKAVVEVDKEKISHNKSGFCCLIVNDVEESTLLGKILGLRIPERAAK